VYLELKVSCVKDRQVKIRKEKKKNGVKQIKFEET
jgi:hypothetical protein